VLVGAARAVAVLDRRDGPAGRAAGAMSFGRLRRSRRVVVTAFSEDRRILRQWELDLGVGQRIPIPDGTRIVQVHDPGTVARTRVDLGQVRRQRRA
jgi:hypothetical protein